MGQLDKIFPWKLENVSRNVRYTVYGIYEPRGKEKQLVEEDGVSMGAGAERILLLSAQSVRDSEGARSFCSALAVTLMSAAILIPFGEDSLVGRATSVLGPSSSSCGADWLAQKGIQVGVLSVFSALSVATAFISTGLLSGNIDEALDESLDEKNV